jgi:hypothetical protein
MTALIAAKPGAFKKVVPAENAAPLPPDDDDDDDDE